MGVRVDGADGPLALGAKGSACDWLRLTGGLRALALGSYIISLRWRGGRPLGRQYKCRLRRRKPYNTTALRASEMHSSLVAGATTLPGGKRVTGFAGRLQLPYESSSFATPAVRWGGKRKAP